MDIHEYQAKELLSGFGVMVPPGGVAYSPEQAVYVATELGGWHWAVKAQIHAGGRGKAGGVKLCRTYQEVATAAKALLGATLVTNQTGPAGKMVHRLYVEKAEPFVRALYLGFVLDRKIERVRVIASAEGGVEIEEIAREPAATASCRSRSIRRSDCRRFRRANWPSAWDSTSSRSARRSPRSWAATAPSAIWMRPWSRSIRWWSPRMTACSRSMPRCPSTTTRCSAAPRSPKCAIPPRRIRARPRPRSSASTTSVSSGDIGCIINGAGLAMATMDMIKHAGGEPANFLDVGGGASPERVAAAFNLVLSDRNVKAILVNIFAGINRCDWVAQGVVQAAKDLRVPLVVRLAGTNVEEGRRIVAECGLPIISADTLAEAAHKVVAASRGEAVSGARGAR